MIRRSTWIILGVFLLLVASTLVWQRYGKKETAEITPTTEQELLIKLTTKVTGLRIEGVGSQIVEVIRDEQGQWKLIVPEGHETDTDSVESAVSQLSNLRVLSQFEQGLDLGNTGLVIPAYRITISLEDDERISLDVGKATATGSGYYVRMGEKDVYVVSKYSLDSILGLAQNPPYKPTPTPPMEITISPSEIITPSISTESPASTSSP